jgi:Leucine-rich repeat (LRR) protein
MFLDLSEKDITSLTFGATRVLIEYSTGATEEVILPRGLETLWCSNNQLTTLENLPKNLKILICHINRLTGLENLPEGLEQLDCSSNQLTVLEGLPKGLKKLDCFDNLLTSLENLPSGLEALNCYNNNISALEGLPKSLLTLVCHENPLEGIDLSPLLKNLLFPSSFSRIEKHYQFYRNKWISLKKYQAGMLTLLAKNGVSFASLEILSDEFAIHLKLLFRNWRKN